METGDNVDKTKEKSLSKQITTIKLSIETKQRLDKFRVYRRETYDEILIKILGILNLSKTNPERTASKLASIDRNHKRISNPHL